LLNGQSPDGSSLGGRRRARKTMSHDFIAGLVVEEFGLERKQALTVAAIWIAAASGAIDSWIERRGSRRELTDLYVALVLGGLTRVAGR
jgi:hypothetical protein